jgi:UrcA family protein
MTTSTFTFGTALMHIGAAVIASAFMVGISAGPALAADASRPVSIEVPVSSADFATPKGRAGFDAKLVRAANTACRVSETGRDLVAYREAAACRDAALAEARAQFAKAQLAWVAANGADQVL